MGVSVISMVLPLTILLASIMTFGEFGERYELAAMKAAGISLTRIMAPLFWIVVMMSVLLFFFSNNIIPDFQRKAKNMLYNIAATKPALNFEPGQFISSIDGFTVKFDKISGKNGENLDGVFVHKTGESYQSKQTIIAKKGKFVPAVDKHYLKLVLFDGYVFEDNAEDDFRQRLKQINQSAKFDTLVEHFDISDLISKAIEQEKITEDYRFQTYRQLNTTIVKNKQDNELSFKSISEEISSQNNNYVAYIDKTKPKEKTKPQYKLDTIKTDKKNEILFAAYNNIESLRNSTKSKNELIVNIEKYNSRIIMYQQRIIAYSITCIIFYLIGASLGSIIRKGGMGLPVVIAIVIFIIFYVLNLSTENMAWAGKMNPYLATWIPNMILFPFGIWLTYKALTDSQVFDIEKYKALLKPITQRFMKPKEHQRYQ